MNIETSVNPESRLEIYFSDVFNVPSSALKTYGAFNVSLVTDLPLFIDPFLLFTSKKVRYQQLHDRMITYLRFLKRQSEAGLSDLGLIRLWYCFPEVRQNWLGFSKIGNGGRGPGLRFGRTLNDNLARVFKDFGEERITKGSHIEKLCLIGRGSGRDMISDFTMNLIKDFLLEYTQKFARKYIHPDLRAEFTVPHCAFDEQREVWIPGRYELPAFNNSYVILTPLDILTREATWINYGDMLSSFREIPPAIENSQLRAAINNYFYSVLPRKAKKSDYEKAAESTLAKFPILLDYYIRLKEDNGDMAITTSEIKVSNSHRLYVQQFSALASLLTRLLSDNTVLETRERIEFFKDVVENKGGYRYFYLDGQPVRREEDVHIAFRFAWYGTSSDVSREVNDGRGFADYKISRGSLDKTVIEFKLASNSKLRMNLAKQAEIYQKASDAGAAFKVILFFTEEEEGRVKAILYDLGLLNNNKVFLIDARNDNKPSASKA